MLLAVLSANAGAGAATDAGPRIGNRHDLTQDLLIVVQTHQIPIFREAMKCHDIATADFETSSTANTGFWIDSQ